MIQHIAVHRRLAHLLLLLLLTVSLVAVPACSRSTASPAEWEDASAYGFSLVRWHVANVPFKLAQLPFTLGGLPTLAEESGLLDDFFNVAAELARLERELEREVSLHGGDTAQAVALQTEIERARREHGSMAPRAEALIQHQVATTLTSQDLGLEFGGCTLTFPPVVFVFERPPKLLVLSPRDRVERTSDMLLSPDISVQEIEALENEILQQHDLSALVVTLGGIATYPSMVNEHSDLYNSVFIAVHEWTHQYLFFHPLGRAYFQGGVVQEMNEAVADIVGREVADTVCPPDIDAPSEAAPAVGNATAFDFTTEMRQTRATLDSLLEQGRVSEAEDYLEERRQAFVAQGYSIRKLNQAYFAFHGTYAFSPASVSPVGAQMEELRAYYPTLGEFVRAVQGLSTHQQLLALLVEKRSQQYPGQDAP